MATAKALSSAAWRARAEELAYQKHTMGAASYVGEGATGAHVWRVPSRSEAGAYYLVSVWPRINSAVCTCPAGSYGRPCGHAGAALHADAQRQRAIAKPDTDVMRGWRMGGGW